ncbi:MAG TPA: helix-turn-helix domain-containing protein, partial [Microvirga sp.]|nr:helix-turn-helix domain-containing protein [Microvirga sp.]
MSVAAVERCISLIEALAAEPGGMPLGEVAARFKLPKSAVHRILSVLEERGWVMQDRLSQQYALSLRCAMLAFRNLDARGLPDMAQQVLDALAQTTREYCRLAIVEGEGLSWIARAQGAPAGLRYDPDLGQEVVLHATATGKAWLATLPENEAVRLCARELGRRHDGLGPRRL